MRSSLSACGCHRRREDDGCDVLPVARDRGPSMAGVNERLLHRVHDLGSYQGVSIQCSPPCARRTHPRLACRVAGQMRLRPAPDPENAQPRESSSSRPPHPYPVGLVRAAAVEPRRSSTEMGAGSPPSSCQHCDHERVASGDDAPPRYQGRRTCLPSRPRPARRRASRHLRHGSGRKWSENPVTATGKSLPVIGCTISGSAASRATSIAEVLGSSLPPASSTVRARPGAAWPSAG